MIISSNDQTVISLFLRFRSWSRDSHGLYDYECEQTRNNNFKIQSEKKIIRRKNEIKLEFPNYLLNSDEQELGKIYVNQNNQFFLENQIPSKMKPNEININSLQDKIWYIIKSEGINDPQNKNPIFTSENFFAEIKLNDIIKLGRVKYVVTETKIKNQLMSIEKNPNDHQVFELIQDYEFRGDKKKEESVCKICLIESDESENPLINLCLCSGTMRYVHLICLKLWMGTKIHIKENDKKTVKSFNMKSFNCEICKTPYSLKFRSKLGFFDLIDYNRPENKDYFILESLNQMKENNNFKSIHIITLEEGENIIVGRGHDSNVRINDISVSRTHAMICFSNGVIQVKDLQSKFGTLILIKNEIRINSEKKVSLQIGRTLLEISLIKEKESNLNPINYLVNEEGTHNKEKNNLIRVQEKHKNDEDEMEID